MYLLQRVFGCLGMLAALSASADAWAKQTSTESNQVGSVPAVYTSSPVAIPEHWPRDFADLSARLQQRAERLGIDYAELVIFNGQRELERVRLGQYQGDSSPALLSGQLSELLTALTVMQLIERGEWSVFDEVQQRLPQLSLNNPYAAEQPLLLLHLLEHSSGLDQRRFKSHFMTSGTRELPLLERLEREQSPLTVRWQPGDATRYSALNYGLIAAMLEHYKRRPWAEIVREQVVEPLGLDATLLGSAQAADIVVSGWHGLPAQRRPFRNRVMAESEGSWMSVDDLVRIGQHILSRGASNNPALLRADTLVNMEIPRSTLAADAGLGYGMGIGLDTRARYGLWRGRQSALDGYSMNLRYRAEQDIGYALVVNHESVLPALDELVWQYLAADLPLPNMRAGGVAVEQRWAGWYRLQNPEHALLAPLHSLFNLTYMQREGADLTLRPLLGLGASVPLRSIDGSRLAHRQDGSIVGVLFSDQTGQQKLQVHQDVRYKVTHWQALWPLLTFASAWVILLTNPFARADSLRHAWSRRFTTLATLCFLLAAFVAGSLSLEHASDDTWRSILLWLFSLLAPPLAFAGLLSNLRFWSAEPNTIARWRCLIASICASGLGIWLIYSGWFALRTWAW